MQILYIADNRNRHNWGCRATSAALSQLICEKHSIVGRITGKLTLSRNFAYFPFFSGRLNFLVYKNIRISHVTESIVRRLPPFIRSKLDFLSENFDKSIELIKRYSQYNRAYKEINLDLYEYDAIVINGEGTMIMTSPPRRDTLYYLLFAYWAKKRGKKVFFVNAMFSDCPKTGRNERTVALTNSILSKCDAVITRDPLSYRYAKEVIKIKECKYIPDALFSWKKYFQKDYSFIYTRNILPFGYESDNYLDGPELIAHNYICVFGSSSAAWNQEAAKGPYAELVNALKDKLSCPIYLVQTCDGDLFLEKVAEMTDTIFVPVQIPIVVGLNLLAHAGLCISGRYHPSIMASLGGTPCIFLGANSHKNIGLQEMLEYTTCKEYHSCPTKEDIDEICIEAVKRFNQQQIRQKIEAAVAKRAAEAGNIIEYLD